MVSLFHGTAVMYSYGVYVVMTSTAVWFFPSMTCVEESVVWSSLYGCAWWRGLVITGMVTVSEGLLCQNGFNI